MNETERLDNELRRLVRLARDHELRDAPPAIGERFSEVVRLAFADSPSPGHPDRAPASRPSRGNRVLGAEREQLAAALAQRYQDGESIRALAASIGRSHGLVRRLLSESGVLL